MGIEQKYEGKKSKGEDFTVGWNDLEKFIL